MLTAGMNAFAMARFGFRIVHGGGDAFGLLVMGVAAVGILVWALSHSGHNQSAKN
jgi:cbb3-type cytochrome oxidase subunit 3